MELPMYEALRPWYPLIDPRDEHADEGALVEEHIRKVLGPGRHRILELGCGAGNLASFLSSFERTLTDLSPGMLELAARQNPGARLLVGDMRSLRVAEQFDVVLVNDAICYLQTEADVRLALTTVFEHVRPGGVALVMPDCVRESFVESTEFFEADVGDLGLRGVAWMRDPDPSDTICTVDYSWLCRRGHEVRPVHETHVEGLFSTATWERLLNQVGFDVTVVDRDAEPPYCAFSFLGRR